MIAGILTSNVWKGSEFEISTETQIFERNQEFSTNQHNPQAFHLETWFIILIRFKQGCLDMTYLILVFCITIWFYTFPAKANKCFQIFMNKTWNAYYAPKLLSTLHQEDILKVSIPLVSSIASIFHFGTGRGLRVDFNENFVGTWLSIWWSTLPLMRMTRTKTETKTRTKNSLLH